MPAKRVLKPTFRALSEAQCRALLARMHVGRIAYAVGRRVDIEPIGYVYAGGNIVVRTSPGSKLDALRGNPWVAFEVDDIAGPFDWRSVVAHATAYRLNPTGTRAEVEAYRSAVSQLRALAPATLRTDDPVPFRNVVLRLYIDDIVGRSASTRPPRARKRSGRSVRETRT